MFTIKRIALALLIVSVLLCGCHKVSNTDSSVYSDYATKYLDYENAKSCDFSFGGELITMKQGDTHAGFKLTKLQCRTNDGGNYNIRASFSCDLCVSGTLSYLQGSAFEKLILFYPDDYSVFPQIYGTSMADFVVVLENNNPQEKFGIIEGQPFSAYTELNVTSFSIQYTLNGTVCYLDIK